MDCMTGLLLLARPVYTVNNISRYAEIWDLRCDQTLQKILENKTHEYF